MGQEHPTMNPTVLKSALRQAKARIGIRRGQKINMIAKKKKEIKSHLESGNEAMALIHVEPLINDERMIPCYDILAMMCDAVLERMPMMSKMGREVPPDMFVTLHTLVYAAHRAGIDELITIAQQISALYGKEFAKQSETDEKCINDTIRQNINLIMPEEGWKVERLIEIAREEGMQYTPTEKSLAAYRKYSDAKAGVTDIGKGFPGAPGGTPYNLQPGFMMPQPAMPQPVLPPGPYTYMQGPPPSGNQYYNPPPSQPSSQPPYQPPSQPPSNPPPHSEPHYPPMSGPGPHYPSMDPMPGPPPAMPPPAPQPQYPPPENKDPGLDDFEARLANLKKM